MTNFTTRALGVADLAFARQLFDLWRGDEVTSPPASDETLIRLLSREDFHVIAAFYDGEIIGGLTAYELEMYTESATELFIYEVGVEEAFHRRGIGRALFEEAKKICRARNLSMLYVPALANDERAIAFYSGIGLKREDVAWFSYEFEDLKKLPTKE